VNNNYINFRVKFNNVGIFFIFNSSNSVVARFAWSRTLSIGCNWSYLWGLLGILFGLSFAIIGATALFVGYLHYSCLVLLDMYWCNNYLTHMSQIESKTIVDDIQTGSFFHTMKAESYYGVSFKNEKQFQEALTSCLDDYYNTRRIHTSIENQAPIVYEKSDI